MNNKPNSQNKWNNKKFDVDIKIHKEQLNLKLQEI